MIQTRDANHPKVSLIEHFQDLPDPRANRTKDHDLIDLLVIAVCTLLCAGESFNDMEDFGHAKHAWFKTFLTLRNGIPSHDTFNRLFAALDPKAFLDCFLRWTQSLRQAVPQEIVALDGKASSSTPVGIMPSCCAYLVSKLRCICLGDASLGA